MKIILVNIRYFLSGGPERYMFNIKEVLESHGHTVIPFSIKHSSNEQSEYNSYFLEQIGKGEETYFSEYKKNNIKDLVKLIGRLFYSFEAKKKLSLLIKATNPDIIYVLNFENKISPSILDASKKMKVPVVLRISDFALICAANIFFLKGKQEICEKCLTKGKHNLLINKCFHDSFLYSLMKYSSYLLHDLIKIDSKISAFVIPSNFTKTKFIESGISANKVFHIPTFFNNNTTKYTIEYEDFALYIGRIDPDKGIKTLVDAFVDTNYKLKIIGFSSSNYEEFLNSYLEGKTHSISFLGKMSFAEIEPYLQKCCFTIVPSEVYDNFPNTILESFAFKKAVIATNIGSLKELVEDNKTGLLFKYRGSNDLRRKAIELFSDKNKAKVLGENGFVKLNTEFSKDKHYESLMSLFNTLT